MAAKYQLSSIKSTDPKFKTYEGIKITPNFMAEKLQFSIVFNWCGYIKCCSFE